MQIRIVHLYANLMNIYGDRGNILSLTRRCQWRGIDVDVAVVGIGETFKPDEADLIFFGGGQDKEQLRIAPDLRETKGDAIKVAVEGGTALLAVCGGYQLLGSYLKTAELGTIDGIGLFDAWSVAGTRRCIGNIVIETTFTGQPRTLVGFENHSMQTYLGPGCKPLGRVLAGYGNNLRDHHEGAIYKTAFGCYLHGSLLPKNPWFTDYLLQLALRHRYGVETELPPLLERQSDALEERAHEAVIERIRKLGQLKTGVT